MDDHVYVFVVDIGHQDRRAHAVEQAFGVRVDKRQHPQPQGQDPAEPAHQHRGPPPRHQAGDRHAAARQQDRPIRVAEGAEPTCLSAPASPPAPDAASRRSRTSPRSRAATPEQSLIGAKPSDGRAQRRRPQDLAPPRWRAQAAVPLVDFRRNKDGVPAKVAHIEYDPNRNARIALLHYVDGEKRYILAPPRSGGRPAAVGPGRRDPGGQRPSAPLHPGGLGRPQRRAAPGRRRQAGPGRGDERPARGQGRRLRHPAAALDRDAPGAHRLPGHARRRRQPRARADQARARPAATAGRACAPRPVAWP